MTRGIHQGQQLLSKGKDIEEAKAVMIMLHGRGASAFDILSLAEELANDKFAYLAPQAVQNSWYPHRFIESLEKNEPWLSSALQIIEDLIKGLKERGIPAKKIFLLGFSQGACLALEYAARNAQKYGGIFGLSGGLIGPPGTLWDFSGFLEGTPVFLGCSERDFHIPQERVIESAEKFKEIGAEVTLKLYPDLGHTINQDEIKIVREIMQKCAG
ncbi:MAG: dienelactone hydrolase family protein [bacterium]|nr:MAG: dienelactone hydrolase family protein [bacterium]